MKYSKYLLLALSIAFINVAEAARPMKLVNLPFANEPIYSETHTGLFFGYDMSGSPARKVVCELKNIYKSWLEFKDKGDMRESGVYGDFETVILTSKGQGAEIDESTDMFHADALGGVKVLAIRHGDNPNPTASCHYEPDISSK